MVITVLKRISLSAWVRSRERGTGSLISTISWNRASNYKLEILILSGGEKSYFQCLDFKSWRIITSKVGLPIPAQSYLYLFLCVHMWLTIKYYHFIAKLLQSVPYTNKLFFFFFNQAHKYSKHLLKMLAKHLVNLEISWHCAGCCWAFSFCVNLGGCEGWNEASCTWRAFSA